MSERLGLNFRDGLLQNAILYDGRRVKIRDLRSPRHECEAFISLEVMDDECSVVAYLTPEAAEDLHRQLQAIFAAEPSA